MNIDMYEIEAKFYVVERRTMIPLMATATHLTQAYLRVPSSLQAERRIRKKKKDGTVEYLYTEKSQTSVSGKRKETEIHISRFKYYWNLWFMRDWKYWIIKKIRFTYTFQGNTLEHDIFSGRLKDLEIIEVEVRDIISLDNISLPTGSVYLTVTHDKRYSNAALARHGIPQPNKTGGLQ